jgi:hypothetical protein
MNLFIQSLPGIKLLFWIVFIYKLGVFIGLPLALLLNYLYDRLMLRYFKLEPLSANDYTFVLSNSEEGEQFTFMGISCFDKYDPVVMKQILVDRGIKKYRKLRSKVVYKFFNWWWQEQDDIEGVINEVFSEPIRKLKINSREELVQFGVNELMTKFDLKKQIPYKIIFVQNEDNPPEFRNVMMFKYDHVLSDGLGITCLILGLSDNYSINLFPAGMQKIMSPIHYLLTFLTLPYYSIYNGYRNLYGLRSGDTPFKLKKPLSGVPVIVSSPGLEFALYNKVRNHLGITFNDLIMSVFSSALKKFCTQHYTRVPEKIITMTPISSRAIPKDISQLQITNDSTGIACELTLHDDPIEKCKVISSEFKNHVRNIPMANVTKLFINFVTCHLPVYITRLIFTTASKNFDITYTNVPGPKEAVYYGGSKMHELIPIFTSGFGPAFIAINSYNGIFRVSITYDKSLEQDPDLLLQLFLKELEYVRDNYDKKVK